MSTELQPINILVVGQGAREHAIAWKLRKSTGIGELYVAPGNGGTVAVAKNVDIDPLDNLSLAHFAKENNIGLTIVGPEKPLAAGIVNTFQQEGLRIFGPTKEAAQIESSKAWGDAFMNKYHIPHPPCRVFHANQAQEAIQFVSQSQYEDIIIKADGLVDGKGVIIPRSNEESVAAIHGMLIDERFGVEGKTIVIQKRLMGREVSAHAISDGVTYRMFPFSRDSKALHGVNTGGMGAYTPLDDIDYTMSERIRKEIIEPTLFGMAQEGIPFKGMLYPGIMITEEGPMVLEFNVRFGDPETQAYMCLLQSDLLQLLRASTDGKLGHKQLLWHHGYAMSVVIASEGYPSAPQIGYPIEGLEMLPDHGIHVFHAGTKYEQDVLVTNGGRILSLAVRSSTLESTRSTIYRYIGSPYIHVKNMQVSEI